MLSVYLKSIQNYTTSKELKLNDIGMRTGYCNHFYFDARTLVDNLVVYYDLQSIMGVKIQLDNGKKLDWGSFKGSGYQDNLEFTSLEPFIGFFASLTTDNSALKTLGAL